MNVSTYCLSPFDSGLDQPLALGPVALGLL